MSEPNRSNSIAKSPTTAVDRGSYTSLPEEQGNTLRTNAASPTPEYTKSGIAYSSGIEVVRDEFPEASPSQFQQGYRVGGENASGSSGFTPHQGPHGVYQAYPLQPGQPMMGGMGAGMGQQQAGGDLYSPFTDTTMGQPVSAWQAAAAQKDGNGVYIPPPEKRSWSRRELYLTALAVVQFIAIIIIAVVLGMKYGQTKKDLERTSVELEKASNGTRTGGPPPGWRPGIPVTRPSEADVDPGTIETPSTDGDSNGVRKLTALAAAGYFPGANENAVQGSGRAYELQLFFQDVDDYIVTSSQDSITGSWASRPRRLFRGKADTPLAAASFKRSDFFMENGIEGYQTAIFHNDGAFGRDLLKEWNFSPAGSGNGTLSESTSFGAKFRSGIAANWASGIWYEGDKNRLAHVWFARGKSGYRSWAEEATLKAGSSIVVMPDEVAERGSVKVFFQTEDNVIQEWSWKMDDEGGHGENSRGDSLIEIPSGTKMAGFSTSPSSSASKGEALDLYLLYQDLDSGDILVYYKRDKEWRGPDSHEVLRKADKGTSIACVAMDTVRANQGSELNRCYFQSEGAIVEVGMNANGEWKVLGTVPV